MKIIIEYDTNDLRPKVTVDGEVINRIADVSFGYATRTENTAQNIYFYLENYSEHGEDFGSPLKVRGFGINPFIRKGGQ